MCGCTTSLKVALRGQGRVFRSCGWNVIPRVGADGIGTFAMADEGEVGERHFWMDSKSSEGECLWWEGRKCWNRCEGCV